MAHIFEGDISQLNERQLKFIGEVLDKEGYNDSKVSINRVGEAGDNYIANVKRIIAEKNGETLKLIAKVAPTIEQMRAQMRTHNLFNNEFIMYTKVLPKYTELEISAGIREEERLRYAKCYGCFMEAPYEVILLEDLQVSGFTIFDRFKFLPEENVRQTLKSFAKLHALSYVFRHREPESFESIKKSLLNVWLAFANDDLMKLYYKGIQGDAQKLLDSQKHVELVKMVFENITTIVNKLNDTDFKSKHSVIQQGDSWTNNLMFQSEDGKATSCCMIDYQISRVNSPVADLHYMIFNCTDYESRAKYYLDWIDYYHAELDNSLSEFGLKVNNVYPRDKLDADLRRHGKSALIFSVMLSSGVIMKNDDAAKMKMLMENTDFTDIENVTKMMETTTMTALDEETKELYKKRVAGVIDSMLEFGLI